MRLEFRAATSCKRLESGSSSQDSSTCSTAFQRSYRRAPWEQKKRGPRVRGGIFRCGAPGANRRSQSNVLHLAGSVPSQGLSRRESLSLRYGLSIQSEKFGINNPGFLPHLFLHFFPYT
ncbi:hypothetical protein TRVA0_005S00826 [Trichomonascus vanleenenianus]|uniref:uncharacterized protein n=1 Tax=Trichomonascus vanleenenianus TaxID=2268995 RepID=UPI003ECB1738